MEISVDRLIAKLPTIAAYAYKHSDPVVEKAIDLLLILHADHEQNCSTSTVRLVDSSRS